MMRSWKQLRQLWCDSRPNFWPILVVFSSADLFFFFFLIIFFTLSVDDFGNLGIGTASVCRLSTDNLFDFTCVYGTPNRSSDGRTSGDKQATATRLVGRYFWLTDRRLIVTWLWGSGWCISSMKCCFSPLCERKHHLVNRQLRACRPIVAWFMLVSRQKKKVCRRSAADRATVGLI